MTAELKLYIPTMTCASCARRVREALNAVAGIESLEIDPASRTVRVTGPDLSRSGQLINALAAAGYAATLT